MKTEDDLSKVANTTADNKRGCKTFDGHLFKKLKVKGSETAQSMSNINSVPAKSSFKNEIFKKRTGTL